MRQCAARIQPLDSGSLGGRRDDWWDPGFLDSRCLNPLLVNEAGDLAPSLAKWLLRWGARRIGQADQAGRYEEEWLADLERVPGKLIKLIHACGVLIRSVRPLRAQFHRRSRPAQLPARIIGRISRRLGSSQEIDARLRQVTEMLVPRLADHCFIDLFQGDELIRRTARHTGDWTPPPGTWAQAGEQIHYPQGHFCQQAMARLDTVMAGDPTNRFPAPSAQSAATAKEIGLTSIIAAPLCARGVLLGVLSVARSNLTTRTEPFFTTADQDLISAIAHQVATTIDGAMPPQTGHQTALTSQNPATGRPANAFPA